MSPFSFEVRRKPDGVVDSDLFRLTSFINSSLEFELHDLDDTADGVLRVEDLLCRVRELSVMGGVRLYAHPADAALTSSHAGTSRGSRAIPSRLPLHLGRRVTPPSHLRPRRTAEAFAVRR